MYVEPFAEPLGETGDAYRVIYTQGLADAFGRLRQELVGTERASVETVALQGAVAPQLLSFAARVDADVIAVGSQQHTMTHRAFVGSVTTGTRAGRESLALVVPPRAPNADSAARQAMVETSLARPFTATIGWATTPGVAFGSENEKTLPDGEDPGELRFGRTDGIIGSLLGDQQVLDDVLAPKRDGHPGSPSAVRPGEPSTPTLDDSALPLTHAMNRSRAPQCRAASGAP